MSINGIIALDTVLPKDANVDWLQETLCTVNGNKVRLRRMVNTCANLHTQEDSDELFIVPNGTVLIDVEDETHTLTENQMLVVPAGQKHRARTEGTATLLVIDQLG